MGCTRTAPKSAEQQNAYQSENQKNSRVLYYNSEMKKYKRYQSSAGKYDSTLYKIRKGRERYPHTLPERLICDFKVAYKRNNNLLRKFRRSRNWHEERRILRKKWGIPDNGLSPGKLDAWLENYYKKLYDERCNNDPKLYTKLLLEFDLDIEKIIEKHKLSRIPFIGANLEKYIFLNSRYCKYKWMYFSGYIFINDEGEREVMVSPYFKVPYSLKKILIDMVENGVPKNSSYVLEIRQHPIGLTWQLLAKNCRPT